jgi:tetratricopeptide (TPR) repeat protein
MGALLLDMQRPQAAIDTLQTGLTLLDRSPTGGQDADLVQTHHRLALAYLMLGQMERAEQEFLQVTALQPEYAEAHLYLGRLYFQQRKFDQAWHHARQAEILGPPAVALLNALQQVSREP